MRLLETLGYKETLRSYGAEVDVGRLELTRFGDPEAELARQGITLTTLEALQRLDPDYQRKLYELYAASNRDIPEVGPTATLTPAAFAAHVQRTDTLLGGYHVAQQGELYVGYSELFAGRETTAVLRPYRRRGIALALKLRGLVFAKALGYTRITTGMASNNLPMVKLNTRLGFVPKDSYITYCNTMTL